MKKVTVIFGGPSNEAAVSRNTAKAVHTALLELGYTASLLEFRQESIATDIQTSKADIVYNAMHGLFGEDGVLPALCELLQVAYTHSGVKASAIAMDKDISKRLLANSGINLAKSFRAKGSDIAANNLISLTNGDIANWEKIVIKPNNEGSSQELHIFNNLEQIESQKYHTKKDYIIEEFISGEEVSVGVLGDNALAAVKITSESGIYDYNAKYITGKTQYQVPADLPEAIYSQALNHAKKAHDLLGCYGVSRSDFIYDKNKDKLYYLETNTHPGMTKTSLLPKMAACKNISFNELVETILLQALQR